MVLLCVEMTGPVQTMGEYILDPIDGEPKKHRNRMKPTAKQISISKSLTTSIGATPLWIAKGWKGLEVYKVAQPTSIDVFRGAGHFIAFSARERVQPTSIGVFSRV